MLCLLTSKFQTSTIGYYDLQDYNGYAERKVIYYTLKDMVLYKQIFLVDGIRKSDG